MTYHYKHPEGVVEEDDGGSHEHGEADEFVKLSRRRKSQTARQSICKVACLVTILGFNLGRGAG